MTRIRQKDCLMLNEVETKINNALEDMISLGPHLQLVQDQKGKASIKLSLAALPKIQNLIHNIDGLFTKIPGMVDVKTNLFSRTIVLQYDPLIFPPDIISKLVNLHLHPGKRPYLVSELSTFIKATM